MLRTATFLLALSVAGAAQAAHILVPQHAASINDALILAGPGGTVTVDEGIYHETIAIPFDGQTLRGHGHVRVDPGGLTGLVVPLGVTGTMVRGLQFQNAWFGMLLVGPDTRVRNCKVKNASSHGILVVGPEVTIEDSSVKDAGLTGVFVDADGCVILNCCIARTGEAGVSVMGDFNSIISSTIRETCAQGILIGDEAVPAMNNLVMACDIRLTGGDGIELCRMAFACSVRDNDIRDTSWDGIDVRWLSSGHSLTKNVIRGAGDCGIEVGGPDVFAGRNKVNKSWNDGIYMDGDAVNGVYLKNKVKSCMDDGFFVAGTGNSFTKNTAVHNHGFDLNSAVPLAANTYVDNVFLTSN